MGAAVVFGAVAIASVGLRLFAQLVEVLPSRRVALHTSCADEVLARVLVQFVVDALRR